MNLKTCFLPNSLILAIILLVFSPGFPQVKNTETVSISGFIERINEDLDVIQVKGMRILIPPRTRIVDGNGNVFKKDLRRDFYVEIEAAQNRDGLLAKKII